MERFPQQPQEHILIPYEESRKMARNLLKKHEEELLIAESVSEPFDEGVSPFDHEAIEYFLKAIPHEIQEEFIAHGITRNSTEDQLAAFINILQNQSLKGSADRLVSGQRTHIPAYKRTPFLILSHFKQELAVIGEDGHGERNELGLVIDPGAYILNNDYYPLAEDLQVMFPKKNIIKANQIPAYIDQEARNPDIA